MTNIIPNKKIFFAISGTLLLVSLACIIVFGFRPGIDLVGGTLWQIKTEGVLNENALREFFTKAGAESLVINKELDGESFIVRGILIEEDKHQEYLSLLNKEFGNIEELRFESIGPTIGKELRTRAIWAIVLVLFGISIYVAFVFRHASRPVSSFRYGLITVLTLFHDVLIPAGLMALLGRFMHQEIDTNFIVALLVIMGFSVHDTIVVFDRIRENLKLREERKLNVSDFPNIVNTSINETMPRSVNTSLTLAIVLVALYLFGPLVLKNFI